MQETNDIREDRPVLCPVHDLHQENGPPLPDTVE